MTPGGNLDPICPYPAPPHLAKSLDVTHRVWEDINKKNSQKSQKNSFLAQFQPFLNTSKRTIQYLMHHLTCHHWSKFQTKLTTFWGVLAKKNTQKQPKMTVSSNTKTFENNSRTTDSISMKHSLYVYHLSTFHLLKTEYHLRGSWGRIQKTIRKSWLHKNLGFNIT